MKEKPLKNLLSRYVAISQVIYWMQIHFTNSPLKTNMNCSDSKDGRVYYEFSGVKEFTSQIKQKAKRALYDSSDWRKFH